MNWGYLRPIPWLDTRARFVSQARPGGYLLDLGSSDGETLNHIAELRPDLALFAVDKFGQPEKYPKRCQFQRADFECDRIPWTDASMDIVTCMHLVEHLKNPSKLFAEVARVLKPGGKAYFETPHPKTLDLPSLRGAFTMNFHDDSTHTHIVTTETISGLARVNRLEVEASGISRNWLFASSHLFFKFFPPSRRKFTAQVHWIGWSAFLIARKPA